MNDIMNKMFIEMYKEKYGEHIAPELAQSLVCGMAVTDNSGRPTGEKWTLAETKDAGSKIGINFEKVKPAEWYLVMNMMYSDYYRTAKKHGMTEPSFFADLSFDWFNDEDAETGKTFRYFMD